MRPTPFVMPRRAVLQQLTAGAVASLLPARLTLAAGSDQPEAPRLVVLMLRGALDGLAAVPAPGDPHWAALRGRQPADAAPPLPLDGTPFALHPALVQLHRWWSARELLVLHAIASPYRERSHFDAQQLLESGGERPFTLATGWLGRALQASNRSAVALNPALPLALRGADQASTWTPGHPAEASDDLLERVGRLYGEDRLLADTWAKAMAQQGRARHAERAGSAMGGAASGMEGGNGGGLVALARQAGALLSAEQGPRVAWLETGGWDTHAQQAPRLQRLLAALDAGLAELRSALGPLWQRSTVLVLTEFGRTAVPNGSGGTDHGSGGVALLAGGAVAGGRVLTDWPGLAPTQLLDGRDLRPTQDIRTVIGAVLQRQFGLARSQLLAGVLPSAPAADGLALWRS